MATAMTDNSSHSSGTTTPTHVLQVPSTTSTSPSHRGLLPFPTSPSLPDRRSRLRRLRVSLATHNAEPTNTTTSTSSYDFLSSDSNSKPTWRSSTNSNTKSNFSTYNSVDDGYTGGLRHSINILDQNHHHHDLSSNHDVTNRRRKYRDVGGDGQTPATTTWSKERERKVGERRMVERDSKENKNREGDEKRELFRRLGPPVLPPVGFTDQASPPPPTSSNTVNTARSHRRNIITPRNCPSIMMDAFALQTRDGGCVGDTMTTYPSRKESKEAARSEELQPLASVVVEELEEEEFEVEGVKEEEEDEWEEDNGGDEDSLHVRRPRISLRKSSPPLHEDFFLTSLAEYEDPPLRGNRKSSTTSKESGGKEKEEEVAAPRDGTPSSKQSHDVTKAPSPSRDLQITTPPSDNLVLTDAEKSNMSPEDIADDTKVTTTTTTTTSDEENQNNIKEKDKSKDPINKPNHADPAPSTPHVPTTSRIPVPIVTSSREIPREPRETPRDTRGLQRVYLEGLDHMRGHVTSVEEEMDKIDREFHKIHTSSGGDRMYYLKECNERLLQANSELRKHDVSLEVIDSSTRLVRLLNGLRALKPPADKDLVDFLTLFWEDSKSTTEQLKALLMKFDTTVLQRLSNNYITSHSADLKVPICQQYASDIEDFLQDLGQQLADAHTLIKSYEGGIHQDLLDTTDFSDQLMLMCDLNAFPVLGFVHAVCHKMSLMCLKARHWLARDETFMHEINTFIKETRSVARRREIVLQNEKEKQKRREKNVKIAQSMLHNNREKLGMIERELQQLEDKLSGSKVEQKQKAEQIHQKETMVDFLKLTLQQTKRNYSLQSKRSKLLRQVQELEDYLKTMENELETVQDMILAKSHEKILLKEKIHNSQQSYDSLKTGLDKFSENLEQLEADVTSLSGQLLHLEIVHTIRTSPETLDNLSDRPSTVKLSQSLKEKIRERKRKAAMTNS